MLISHTLEIIFIKTRKTAGSSFERYIYENHFNPELDILTGSKIDSTPWVNISESAKGHMGWNEVKTLIKNHGKDWWDRYTKVTIERNPWDKVVSQFWFYRKHHQQPDALVGANAWEAFNYSFLHGALVQEYLPTINPFDDLGTKEFKFKGFDGPMDHPDNPFKNQNMPKDWVRYAKDGNLMVDNVLKYETLARDFDWLLKSRGLSLDYDKWANVNMKSGFREDSHYSEMYHEQNIDVIGDYFADEVKAFGYEYDSKVR